MQNEEMEKYVRDERARGVREEDITQALLGKGWKEEDVRVAMGTAPSVAAHVPVGTLIEAGDLISASFTEWKDNFALLTNVLLYPVACFLVAAVLSPNSPTANFLSVSSVFSLLGAILSLLATIGIMKQTRLGWTLSVRETYDTATRYFWQVLWVSILTGFAALGASILFVIPGLIVALWLAFTRPAVVLDDARGINSLSFSRALVSGYWWPVFWRFLVMILVTLIVSIVVGWIPFLGALAIIFSIPFGAIYTVRLYDALKRMKGLTYGEHKATDRGMMIALTVLGVVIIPLMVFMIIVTLGAGAFATVLSAGFPMAH